MASNPGVWSGARRRRSPEPGREVVAAVLLRMDEQITRLEERVMAQERRIADLERKARRSSRNSSQPPSQDPPGTALRRGKDPSGRGQGAQPGHVGKGRPLSPAWALDQVVDHWPSECGCGHALAACELLADGAPARHRLEQLPPIHVVVTEHRCRRVRCPDCGAAARPAAGRRRPERVRHVTDGLDLPADEPGPGAEREWTAR